MEYHRTDDKSCHFGCGLLELVLWRCEEFCGCCGAEKLQVVGEDLIVGTNFHIPKEEDSLGLRKREGICCMCLGVDSSILP
jgi:hypothetical protein